MTTAYMKRRDTAPDLVLLLTNPDGAPPDLAGATGVFSMAAADGTVVVNRRAVALDNSAHTATHSWTSGDTIAAGTYQAEVEVTFADGSILTYPNAGHVRVIITADIA